MKYNTEIETLEEFYSELYSIPARTSRKSITPQAVTEKLLVKLDNPQNNVRSVLVTGSKGKGATVTYLSALVKKSGLHVGMFSSPHLFDFRERIMIDGIMIDEQSLVRLGRKVFAAANELTVENSEEYPRFFEITTAIAYVYFAEKQVDIAVVETGIGALTDATNQYCHELSILTHLENEHGDVFGTLSDIAKEKAGVIKKDTPLILGDLPNKVDDIIMQHAYEMEIPVTRFKKELVVNNNGVYQLPVGNDVWLTDSFVKAKNAWISLKGLRDLNITLSEHDIIETLNETKLHARQEIVSQSPFIIIDGAHSPESIQVLSNYTKKMNPNCAGKSYLLLSLSSGRNIANIAETFTQIDEIVLTQASTQRSLAAESVEQMILPLTKAKLTSINEPEQALQYLNSILTDSDQLIITGSVYLAGWASHEYNA